MTLKEALQARATVYLLEPCPDCQACVGDRCVSFWSNAPVAIHASRRRAAYLRRGKEITAAVMPYLEAMRANSG